MRLAKRVERLRAQAAEGPPPSLLPLDEVAGARLAAGRARTTSGDGRPSMPAAMISSIAIDMIVKEKPEVLFVCVHNAGRSQMAAGLLALRSEGRIDVRSAGSLPAEEIDPAVIEAMREIGVDLGEAFPKPLTDEVVRAADVVVTMGCGDACPIHPGKRYEDWELDDPAGQDVDAVRAIRDEIDARVQRLIGELLAEASDQPKRPVT